MKIGLLTFHFPINYGAILQTYALFTYLKNRGCDVEIINYFTDEHISRYSFFQKPTSFKTLLYNIVKTPFLFCHLKKKKKFDDFKLFLKLTKRYKRISEVPFDYDIVLTGSDQVFNLNYEDRHIYFQPFKKRTGQKKVAYAPSFGISDFSNTLKKKISLLVNDFDVLSCRELNGAEFLKKITGKPVEHVLDPVFLLDATDWDRISSKKLIEEKYLFVYDLNGKKPLIDIALKIRKNYKIVVLSNDPIASIRKEYRDVDIIVKSAGIGDYISLIKHAEAVITDSFHGAAMSIILKKPFFSFIALEKASARIYSLLKSFSLEHRLVKDVRDCLPDIAPNPNTDALQDMVVKSRTFLLNSIQ